MADEQLALWEIERAIRRSLQRDDLGRKCCIRCDEWLDEGFFNGSPNAADKLQPFCRRCKCDGDHRLSLAYRNELLARQGWMCANDKCGNKLALYADTRAGTYQIDHDHKCCPGTYSCGLCIRGLLCHGCNSARGLLRDDPERMRGLAEYSAKEIASAPPVVRRRYKKLTEQEVREIRASTLKQRQLAEMYGLSQSGVSNILLRKTWAHLG